MIGDLNTYANNLKEVYELEQEMGQNSTERSGEKVRYTCARVNGATCKNPDSTGLMVKVFYIGQIFFLN